MQQLWAVGWPKAVLKSRGTVSKPCGPGLRRKWTPIAFLSCINPLGLFFTVRKRVQALCHNLQALHVHLPFASLGPLAPQGGPAGRLPVCHPADFCLLLHPCWSP